MSNPTTAAIVNTPSSFKKRKVEDYGGSDTDSDDAGIGPASGGGAGGIGTTLTSSDIDPNNSQALAGYDAPAVGSFSYKKTPLRPRDKRSEVWNYFDVQEMSNNGALIKVGKCKNCPFYGKYSSSTSFMKDHLKKCKGITYIPTTILSSSRKGEYNGEGMIVDGEDMDGPSSIAKAGVQSPSIASASVAADETGALSSSAIKTPKMARLTGRGSSTATTTKLANDLDYQGIWDFLNDPRRARYPKALSALLEDLGVLEVNDLKNLDVEQYDIILALLKQVQQKLFTDLIKA